MLKLLLRFESSWSNSFFEPDHRTPLFSSGSQLSESHKKLVAVPLPPDTAGLERSSIDYLRALQQANPAMKYRIPESFDSTVQGVLARLMGETARLSDLRNTEPNHLALQAFAAGKYLVKIEDEYSQTASLESYEVNDIQTGGAGLIHNSALWGNTPESRMLFGHLAMSLVDMDEGFATGQPLASTWYAQSPSHLMGRLAQLAEEQAAEFRRAIAEERTPFPAFTRELQRLLPNAVQETLAKRVIAAEGGSNAPTTVATGAMSTWNFAAALVVARIQALDETTKAEFIENGMLTKNGGLAGMAMSGNLGSTTPKDMFKAATGEKAQSTRLPYRVTIPTPQKEQQKSSFIERGVLKKSGTLQFVIEDQPKLEHAVLQAIRDASVGPIHFGKKGVAYIVELRQF